MRIDFGHIVGGIGLLILAYLVLNNWTGANALLSTGATSGGTIIKDLQGR